MVVVRTASTQVYVGWRLLGTDPENIAFNLYRATGAVTSASRRVLSADEARKYTVAAVLDGWGVVIPIPRTGRGI